MRAAIEARGLVKEYRVWRTQERERNRERLMQILLGHAYKGKTVCVETKRVLDDVSLDVGLGEVVVVLGENGSGKSTLLEIIMSSLLPEAGTLKIMGHDALSDSHPARMFISPVLPTLGAMPMWTARQNLMYIAVLYKILRDEAIRRIDKALDLCGLSDRADDLVSRYSTGMRARMAFARALVIDQPVMVMDEPFLGIDSVGASVLREYVRQHCADSRGAALIASNLIADAEEIADQVIILHKGRVIATGSVEEIISSAGIPDVVTVIFETRTTHPIDTTTLCESLVSHGMLEQIEITENLDSPGMMTLTGHARDGQSALVYGIEKLREVGIVIRSCSIERMSLQGALCRITERAKRVA